MQSKWGCCAAYMDKFYKSTSNCPLLKFQINEKLRRPKLNKAMSNFMSTFALLHRTMGVQFFHGCTAFSSMQSQSPSSDVVFSKLF